MTQPTGGVRELVPTPSWLRPPRPAALAGYLAAAWAVLFALSHYAVPVFDRLIPAFSPHQSAAAATLAVNCLIIGLKLLAGLVALATVQPWGRLLPRWLLLAMVWAACAALLVLPMQSFAMSALVQGGIVSTFEPVGWARVGAMDTTALLVQGLVFLPGGVLFGLAAWSYMLRSPAARGWALLGVLGGVGLVNVPPLAFVAFGLV